MKKCKRTSKSIIWLFSIVCIYLVLTDFFPVIRIPFSFLDETNTTNLNNFFSGFALSYFAGLFVYWLTVVYKNKNERMRRKWELDGLLTEFDHLLGIIEEELDRLEKAHVEDLKRCEDETFNKFVDGVTKLLDKTFLYKDILSEAENDAIEEIRRLLSGFSNPPSKMDDEESTRCLLALREIRTNVDKLRTSINKLFGRTGQQRVANK